MMSSVGIDYDGDGNTSEGIYDELVGLRDKLGAAIRTYGSEHGAPICYAANSYPYWFVDGDGNGSCSTAEAVTSNAFASWTAAPAARHLQLPDGEQGSGRVRPQRQVHHRAALRLDHRRQQRAGRQGRHEQGDPHRRRPLQRRQRGGPPLGPGRTGRRDLLVVPRRRGRLPLLRAVPPRPGGPGDRQRPRVRHLPRQARHRLLGDHRGAVGDVPLGRHPAGARVRQRVRDLPPRPRVQGHRRRGDRGGQAGVQERALPARRRGQARLGGPRRLRIRRQDLRRPDDARRGRAVHLLPRSGQQPPHLPDHRRLEQHLPRSATPTRTATRRRSG